MTNMQSSSNSDSEITRLPINSEELHFDKWTISYNKSHILASICPNIEKCEANETTACQLCLYNKALKFPHLPDMVFPNNQLSLSFAGGGAIKFKPMDALKCVDTGRPPVQVACAEEWQESRPNLDQKAKPFDWTFTTDYKGTFEDLQPISTEEKIDIELLKKREKILFYHDLSLFEDELHDHGIAACSVKIRVMPSSWFVLLRYFLRVDNVLTKINDTRFFYQVDSPHVLMEYTARAADIPDLKIAPALLIDPNVLSQHVPLESQLLYKINLPPV